MCPTCCLVAGVVWDEVQGKEADSSLRGRRAAGEERHRVEPKPAETSLSPFQDEKRDDEELSVSGRAVSHILNILNEVPSQRGWIEARTLSMSLWSLKQQQDSQVCPRSEC